MNELRFNSLIDELQNNPDGSNLTDQWNRDYITYHSLVRMHPGLENTPGTSSDNYFSTLTGRIPQRLGSAPAEAH